jgi:dihydropteroate synthase
MTGTVSRSKTPLRLPGGAVLDFSRPLVMAVVNCTPDSFYGASRATAPEDALRLALRAEAEGADIIDFGAESSRPGSDYVGETEELSRLVPVLSAFRKESRLPVSVDTRKAAVARAALDEGADIINDISALYDDPGMAGLCARRGAAVVLMHMRGNPKTMSEIARRRESSGGEGEHEGGLPPVVREVRDFLVLASERARASGIAKENIILDPGIGFGKTTRENLILINGLDKLKRRTLYEQRGQLSHMNRLAEKPAEDYPLLIGLSRKRFIGEITGRNTEDRLAGTLAAAAAALAAGADILRVHDTAGTRDLTKVFTALRDAAPETD